MTEYREQLFKQADRINDLGTRVVMETTIPISGFGAADPKMLAVALLGRTLSNLKAVMLLIRAGHVVEARTLARSCYENMFYVAKLESEGAEFVKLMHADDVASRVKRIKIVTETPELAEKLLEETRRAIDAQKLVFEVTAPRARSLSVKTVSEGNAVSQAYLAYRQLSADAAHPSFSSLARHFSKQQEGDREVRTFDINPLATDDDLDETMYLACTASFGVVVATNQMLGGTPAGQELWALLEEHEKVSRKRWGE